MKFSLFSAVLILAVAAIFGLQQKKTIKRLTTEWEEIESIALAKKISSDPQASVSKRNVRTSTNRTARQDAIKEFGTEFAAFVQKIDESDSADALYQDETIAYIDKLTSMRPTDLTSLVEFFRDNSSLTEETKNSLLTFLILMLSSEQPETALAILSEADMGVGVSHSRLLGRVLNQWGATDPGAAARWALENESAFGEDVEYWQQQLVAAATLRDFDSALEVTNTLGLNDTIEANVMLAGIIHEGNLDQFLQILKNPKGSEEIRLPTLESFARSPFVKGDFETVTTWLENFDLSQTDREALISGLEYSSVESSPESWLGWIAEQSISDDISKTAMADILTDWSNHNYIAAGEWLQAQEPGPTKTAAVQTYAENLAPHEPAAAAEWAGTLPESPERKKLLTTIHSTLRKIDSTAASALAEKHGLDVGETVSKD